MGDHAAGVLPARGLPPERRQPVLSTGAGPGLAAARAALLEDDGLGRRARLGLRRTRPGDRQPRRARAPAGLGCGRRGRSGGSRARHRRRRADDEQALAALEELVARDVLRATAVPRRYAFRHPIVRRAVYEAAGEAWRLGAHARAAAALAARPSAIAARAHHVERSRAPGRRGGRGGPRAGGPPGGRASAGCRRALAVCSAAAAARPPAGGRRAPTGHARRRSRARWRRRGRLAEALDALLQTLERIPPELAGAARTPRRGLRVVRERRSGATAPPMRACCTRSPSCPTTAAPAGRRCRSSSPPMRSTTATSVRCSRWAERAAQTAEALGDPGLLAVAEALVCFAEYALGGSAGRAGPRRERRRA